MDYKAFDVEHQYPMVATVGDEQAAAGPVHGQSQRHELGIQSHVAADVQGADTVRSLAPGAVFIFMLPASFQELQERLAGRMTESSPELDLRLKTAAEEMKQASKFDYRVVNRDGGLERAVAQIDAIITAEKCRTDPRQSGLI